MKTLLNRLRSLPGLEEAPSQWTGGAAFWVDGREIFHVHGGEVEIRLTRKLIRDVDDERVVERTRTSDWVVLPVSATDAIVDLTRRAIAANRR
jgi:Family of unknown function (DUF5519)